MEKHASFLVTGLSWYAGRYDVPGVHDRNSNHLDLYGFLNYLEGDDYYARVRIPNDLCSLILLGVHVSSSSSLQRFFPPPASIPDVCKWSISIIRSNYYSIWSLKIMPCSLILVAPPDDPNRLLVAPPDDPTLQQQERKEENREDHLQDRVVITIEIIFCTIACKDIRSLWPPSWSWRYCCFSALLLKHLCL